MKRQSEIGRIIGLIKYNQDWLPYLLYRYRRPARDASATYRLRNGQTISIPHDARFTLNEIYLDRVYDVPGFDMSRCRTVFDVGANVGVFALYMASRAPDAAIYCFEPQSSNFENLQHNLAIAGVRGQAYKHAISANSGVAELSLNGNSVEYSIKSPSSESSFSEKIDCVSWSDAVRLTGTDWIDFVKMDIEGAELEVLSSCTDEQLFGIGALSLEWHYSMDELQPVADRFRRLGFEVTVELINNQRHLKAQQKSKAG